MPSFAILTDATLTAIAEQRPTDAAALTAIPGIGAAKLDRYGPDLLALVRGGDAPADIPATWADTGTDTA